MLLHFAVIILDKNAEIYGKLLQGEVLWQTEKMSNVQQTDQRLY